MTLAQSGRGQEQTFCQYTRVQDAASRSTRSATDPASIFSEGAVDWRRWCANS